MQVERWRIEDGAPDVSTTMTDDEARKNGQLICRFKINLEDKKLDIEGCEIKPLRAGGKLFSDFS